jgi:hypothetical protein
VPAAERLLAEGFGRDDVPDILAVVLDGSVGSMDKRTHELVAAAERAAGGSVAVVIAGTGNDSGADTGSTDDPPVRVSDVVSQIDAGVPGDPNVIEDVVSGGLFLDQGTLANEEISGDAVVQATMGVTAPDGTRVFADAFQGFAVSFGRYC